ncbi:uncharacterized protein LOC118242961 isoform X2 [Electrophorus electricus]|uniref:uncharacterized protein LOC118242961 isoform X2 n=1 Tax=Electrophorus electricus TaxID=8005 RepID=UPI0015CFAC1F|nr:uncharacterized protein LOC118242961 isoform X2 [Electrophorus electricus]
MNMKFLLPVLGIRLRPAVLCAAGISAVAVTFLVYRWRVRDRQQAVEEAATHTEPSDQLEDREPFPLDQDTFETTCTLILKPLQALHNANRMFAYTFSQMFSADTKMVEVKLQHKSIYSGLESEHWWVLSNAFYHVCAELTLQNFANVNAVACIKRRGTGITEATFYLCAESTESSVQNIFLMAFSGHLSTVTPRPSRRRTPLCFLPDQDHQEDPLHLLLQAFNNPQNTLIGIIHI